MLKAALSVIVLLISTTLWAGDQPVTAWGHWPNGEVKAGNSWVPMPPSTPEPYHQEQQRDQEQPATQQPKRKKPVIMPETTRRTIIDSHGNWATETDMGSMRVIHDNKGRIRTEMIFDQE